MECLACRPPNASDLSIAVRFGLPPHCVGRQWPVGEYVHFVRLICEIGAEIIKVGFHAAHVRREKRSQYKYRFFYVLGRSGYRFVATVRFVSHMRFFSKQAVSPSTPRAEPAIQLLSSDGRG